MITQSTRPELARIRSLLTKLQAPRTVSDHVLRPRLIQAIERGVDRKLTLVITPAGTASRRWSVSG